MLERCHTVHPELSRRAAEMQSGLQVRQGVSLVDVYKRQDYNHPSVILYCVGNEISEAGSESGAETNRRLCNTFRELDPTRYTTNALNGLMAAGYRLREIMGDVMRKFPAQPGPCLLYTSRCV